MTVFSVEESVSVLTECQTSLIIFLTCGIAHREFVPPEHTVNKHFYADVLRQLWEDVWQKWALAHCELVSPQ